MPRQRLGVGLIVPGVAGIEVDGLRRALGDGALGRMPPHLTLVPPVNVRDEVLSEAEAVIRAAAAATAPLRLRLGPAATFHPVTPVVYLEVGGDLAGLRSLRDGVFRPPLQRALAYPFTPHVTIGDGIAPERIPAAVAALADYARDVSVDTVFLLRQEADRVWRPIAEAPLARPAVVGRGGLPLELTVTERPGLDAEHLSAIAGGRPFTVTARREAEVVGLAQGWSSGPLTRVAQLVVAAGARRQGVGGRLLATIEDLARRRSSQLLDLAAPDEPGPRALLAGAGWRQVGPAGTGWQRWEREVPGPR